MQVVESSWVAESSLVILVSGCWVLLAMPCLHGHPHCGGGHQDHVWQKFSNLNSSSEDVANGQREGEVAHAHGYAQGRLEAPTSLKTIVHQLRGVYTNLDVMRENRYEEQNELVDYINDIQFCLNKTPELLESIRKNQRCHNECLCDLEA